MSAPVSLRGLALVLALYFLGLTIVGAVAREDDYRTFGTILLDSITFPKIVPNAENHVLVMVANKGQVGKLSTDGVRDEFLAAAEALEPNVAKGSILFAQVIVNGAQNKRLAGRIGARENFVYPSFHLYKPGSSEPMHFLAPGEAESPALSINAVTRWVYKETGIFIGATGTVDEMDQLVIEFMSPPSAGASEAAVKAAREAVLAKARSAAAALTAPADKEAAPHYIKAMEKLATGQSSFPKEEVARLTAIVESDKVSESRKQEFRKRINIVRRFL